MLILELALRVFNSSLNYEALTRARVPKVTTIIDLIVSIRNIQIKAKKVIQYQNAVKASKMPKFGILQAK